MFAKQMLIGGSRIESLMSEFLVDDMSAIEKSIPLFGENQASNKDIESNANQARLLCEMKKEYAEAREIVAGLRKANPDEFRNYDRLLSAFQSRRTNIRFIREILMGKHGKA